MNDERWRNEKEKGRYDTGVWGCMQTCFCIHPAIHTYSRMTPLHGRVDRGARWQLLGVNMYVSYKFEQLYSTLPFTYNIQYLIQHYTPKHRDIQWHVKSCDSTVTSHIVLISRSLGVVVMLMFWNTTAGIVFVTSQVQYCWTPERCTGAAPYLRCEGATKTTVTTVPSVRLLHWPLN